MKKERNTTNKKLKKTKEEKKEIKETKEGKGFFSTIAIPERTPSHNHCPLIIEERCRDPGIDPLCCPNRIQHSQ